MASVKEHNGCRGCIHVWGAETSFPCSVCSTGHHSETADGIERKDYWIDTSETSTNTAETTVKNYEAEETTSVRSKILREAEKCVCGNREQDYGSPERNFATIANLWTSYLQAIVPEFAYSKLLPHDVASMLSLLKIARISSGHAKQDNWIDLAGYAACGGELEAQNE